MTINHFILFIYQRTTYLLHALHPLKVVILLFMIQIRLPYSRLSSASFYIFHATKPPSLSLSLSLINAWIISLEYCSQWLDKIFWETLKYSYSLKFWHLGHTLKESVFFSREFRLFCDVLWFSLYFENLNKNNAANVWITVDKLLVLVYFLLTQDFFLSSVLYEHVYICL